jgi:hypothetical protein
VKNTSTLIEDSTMTLLLWKNVGLRVTAYSAVIGSAATLWAVLVEVPLRLADTRARVIQTISESAAGDLRKLSYLKCIAGFSASARHPASFADAQITAVLKGLNERLDIVKKASLGSADLLFEEVARSKTSRELNYSTIIQEQRHAMNPDELIRADRVCLLL